MIAQALYYLKRPWHWVRTGLGEALPAIILTHFPQRKLKIITITGTDGKTTSSTLLYHVLKSSGKKVGLISTVAAYLGEEQIDTGFHVTAPGPKQLYHFMKKMVDQGYEYLILEATSHGIYQFRTFGIKPLIAGLTNISHEHLDYHLTYEKYVEAKVLLLKKAKMAVINDDDQSAPRVRRLLRESQATVVQYSNSERLPKVIRDVMLIRFPEAYNQSNVRLVTKIAQHLEIPNEQIAQALKTFPGVAGRMERISNRRRLTIIVDFAHTPQALSAVLTSLKKQLPEGRKLIAIFGCASQRDRGKRPVMTQMAVQIANYVILTAEDPRYEDVWSIFREMKEQLTKGHRKIISIADRRQAIEFALLELAKPGDIVAILGKGHEQSMNIGGVELAWNDSQVIRETLDKPIKKV